MNDSTTVFHISIANMLAAFANAFAALILAYLTSRYVRYTKTQAEAANRQAEAAEAQARAAEAQVRAAEAQARIATEQAESIRAENVRKRANAAMLALMSIQKAKQGVASWFGKIAGTSFPVLPTTIEVTPTGFQASIAEAAIIDRTAAGYMSAAAYYLDSAETELDTLRTLENAQPQAWQDVKLKAFHQLKAANDKLVEADAVMRTALQAPDNLATSDLHKANV